jgi:hypothetical protein
VRRLASVSVPTVSFLVSHIHVHQGLSACTARRQAATETVLVTMIVTQTPRNEPNVVRQAETAWRRRPRPARV